METKFNYDLCEERHERIEKDMADRNRRLEKVENRFIVLLTLLVFNLLGVLGTLFVQLTK